MGEYKTPGVYIKEKNAFGNSIVEGGTPIPGFYRPYRDSPGWNLVSAEQAGADFINDGVQHVFRRCTHTSVHTFF